MVIINWIKGFWYRKIKYARSLKKAIIHANAVKVSRGYKCYVLLFPGGYRAITKQAIKSLMKSDKKYFKKGTTIQHIEKMAVYVTN
jgi:hypothetical protein